MRCALLLALLCPAPAFAADIALKPVYFQTIPFDVLTDARGVPYFRDAGGIYTAKGEKVCPAADGQWLLADRAGRFWFAAGGDQWAMPAVRYYEQGKLVDPQLRSRSGVWEDTAGRVYTFDGRAVHVLADGKWSHYVGLLPKEVRELGEAQFVEDPKGRVWVWLRRGNDLTGAWAFDGTKWTGHTIPGTEADDRVRSVLPFADDWFLVGVVGEKGDPNNPRLVPFSPSRTAEQVAKAKPFAGLPLDRMGYNGQALDGVRYFFRLTGYTAQGTEPSSCWAVAADGSAKRLPDDSSFFHLTNSPAGASATAGAVLFAKPGDRVGLRFDRKRHLMPCSRDADGRIYIPEASPPPHLAYTREYEYATHVLWPAKEKPGDVLRLTPLKPDEYVRDLFRDSAGTAFARRVLDSVRVWDGKRWAGTPVEPLPVAKWEKQGQFPPAELTWGGFGLVGHSTATDGRTLFVRVKTRFAVGKDGKFTPPPDDEKDSPPLWVYEAWAHQGGRWTDAHPPADLLKLRRKELIDGRVCPQPTPGPLPVLSDGTRLWHAQDWTLTVTEADGTAHTAAIPKPKRYVPPKLTPAELERKWFAEMSTSMGPRPEYRNIPDPLMLATLVPLDAKSVLVVVAGTPAKCYKATFRTAKPRGVSVEPVDADWPFYFPTLHAPAGGPPLAWREHESAPVSDDWVGMRDGKSRYEGGFDLYEYRDGKWAKRKDLFKPLAVADDGAVWCPPTDQLAKPLGSKLSLCRLYADKVERFGWNYGDEQTGFTKPPPGAALLGMGNELVCVEPPTKPGGKATFRVLPCADSVSGPPPVVLPDGTILFPYWHGRLFEAKGR